jgi:hypothetical protein
MLRMTTKFGAIGYKYHVEKTSSNHYTITWSKKVQPKVFRFENGDEVDWVIAEDGPSALNLLKSEMDYEDNETYDYKVLSDAELETNFVHEITGHDENDNDIYEKTSFKSHIDAVIEKKPILPIYLAGTIFNQ